MKYKKIIIIGTIIILLITVTLTLPNHVPGIGTYTQEKPAGLWAGIWHGWIAPISLILSMFNNNINIFEPTNTGFCVTIQSPNQIECFVID